MTFLGHTVNVKDGLRSCIDEKHGLGEVVFLRESMEKRSSWIGAVRFE